MQTINAADAASGMPGTHREQNMEGEKKTRKKNVGKQFSNQIFRGFGWPWDVTFISFTLLFNVFLPNETWYVANTLPVVLSVGLPRCPRSTCHATRKYAGYAANVTKNGKLLARYISLSTSPLGRMRTWYFG